MSKKTTDDKTKRIKKSLMMSTTMPLGTAGSTIMGGHVHGPHCNHGHDHHHEHGPDCDHDHEHDEDCCDEDNTNPKGGCC